MTDTICISRWGRLGGDILAASVWYTHTSPDDPDGLTLDGHDGKWVVVASTTLPDGAEHISETEAQAEIRARLDAADDAIEQSRSQAEQQRAADISALVAAGIELDVATRIVKGALRL